MRNKNMKQFILNIYNNYINKKAMAKTPGSVPNSDNGNDNSSQNGTENQKTPTELTNYDKFNLVLKFFNKKNFGEWTPETKVEENFQNLIHYYDIRQILPHLQKEGHLEYTGFQCSYKITYAGKSFIEAGGYK